MTDRYYALTVLLEKDVREDDAEHILHAIRMVKGVLKVEPHVSNPDLWAAETRARYALGRELLKVIYPDETEAAC